MPSTSTQNQNMKKSGGARTQNRNRSRGGGRGRGGGGRPNGGGGARAKNTNRVALPQFDDAKPIASKMGGGAKAPKAASKAPPAAPVQAYAPAQLALRALLIGKVGAAADNDAAAEGAKALAKAVAADVQAFVEADGVAALEKELLSNKKNPVARFGGLKVVEELAALGAAVAPLLMHVFPTVLKLAADKKEKAVRLAAKPAAKAVLAALPEAAVIVLVVVRAHPNNTQAASTLGLV